MPEPTPPWRLDGVRSTLIVLPGRDDRTRATARSALRVEAPPGESTGDAPGRGVPRVHYFGATLESDPDASECEVHEDAPVGHSSLDSPEPLTLCPEASHGYAGSPGLSGHRDGKRFAHRWTLVDVLGPDDERTGPDDGRAGANSLTFVLADETARLRLRIALALDPESDVLSVACTLENTGDSDYTVDFLASATWPLPDAHAEIVSLHGRWGGEFQEHRRAIGPGRLDIANLHGRTGHEHAPFVVTGERGFGNERGDVLYAHLAWSGNSSLRIERLSDGTGTVQLGLLPLPGECRLAPGEWLTTPTACLARGDGMNACTQAFHAHARLRVLPRYTRTPRPIHANSWEALYFDQDGTRLIELIDAAAAIGAERFVLDDGWFGRRRDDTAGLGDWFVDPAVHPDGLHAIVARVRGHGLQFGLWFEPEMVNPDSALYETHPDWLLRLDGIDTPLARHQLALDLSRPEVHAYLLERIVSLVREYSIDYIKWDMNRDLVLAGDGERARAAAQPRSLYRLLDDIVEACPTLEIESCASGGGRVDFGVLARTGRVWTSDNIDPVERARIQAGFLRFLPPEIMGAHVGHEVAHLTGRSTGLHLRAIVALQGQYGFELDARALDAADARTLHHYTALYETHRGWLADSRHHRLDTGEDGLVASGQVAADGNLSLWFVIATARHPRTRPGRLALAGLEPTRRYRLSLESANADELARFNRHLPGWSTGTRTTTGELLMRLGVPLPVMPAQSALLIACRVVPDSPGSAA